MLVEDTRHQEMQPIASHSLQKEVGQNIKDKKRVKELGTETLHPGKEAVKEEKFTNSRKPCHRRVCGEF